MALCCRSKSPFPHCPTASDGGCGQPTSTVNREVRCEHGTGARTAGLAGWLPVEYAQTEASYGGILTVSAAAPFASSFEEAHRQRLHRARSPTRAESIRA